MLVLSRKRSQQILIGDSIRITIVAVDRNQVRIGFEAPDDVSIVRAELLARTEPEPLEFEEAAQEPSIV